MAAKNNDSTRIFDSYVNRYLGILNEGPRGSAPKSPTASAENNPDPAAPNASTGTNGTISNIPGVPPIPASGLTAKIPNPISAVGNAIAGAYTGNGNSTYDIQARKVAAARRAAGLPAVAGQTVQPPAAPAVGAAEPTAVDPTAVSTAAQSPTSTGEPTAEEKELFKKLHGTEFSAGQMNNAKLQQLRVAGQQSGGYSDTEKVRNAAYAAQYGDSAEGKAYARKAEQLGVRLPKPGELQTPAPAAPTPAGNQVAQPTNNNAPTSKPSTATYDEVKNKASGNPEFAAIIKKVAAELGS